MKARSRIIGPLAALSAALCAAAQPAPNQASDRCEAAVAETIGTMRGRAAHEIQFIGAKRTLSPAVGDEEIGVKGEGRYATADGASVPFSYSCAFNAKTGEASGAMFRELGGGARPSAEKAWQPDLANLSPEACESATASALKDKHPQLGRLLFDPQTRQLKPAPNERISLEGRGALQRALGMNAIPFSYRCEFETRSGRLVQVQTSD
jgi:hypothetical protein